MSNVFDKKNPSNFASPGKVVLHTELFNDGLKRGIYRTNAIKKNSSRIRFGGVDCIKFWRPGKSSAREENGRAV